MARMPQVSARELVRLLKAQGFVEHRQSGAHLTLRHPTRKVTVTVPMHTGLMSGGAWPSASSRTRALRSTPICGGDDGSGGDSVRR